MIVKDWHRVVVNITAMMLGRVVRHLIVIVKRRRSDWLRYGAHWVIGLDWIYDLEYQVLTLVEVWLMQALGLQRCALWWSEACSQVWETAIVCLPERVRKRFISGCRLEMWLRVLLLLGWVAWQRIVRYIHTVWFLHQIRKNLVIYDLLLWSIVISDKSTLILIEDVILGVHHIWLKGLIVVWVLMLSLNLLLHALTQVHDL